MSDEAIGTIVALVVVCAMVVLPIWGVAWLLGIPKRRRRRRLAQEAEAATLSGAQKVQGAVGEHVATLAIRRRQLIGQDRYGNVEVGRWIEEANYFWQRNVLPRFTAAEAAIWSSRTPVAVIDECMSRAGVDLSDLSARFSDSDPIEFERYCADLLRARGWEARTTIASNDQGTDVLAMRGGVRLVVQCKLYSSAVGNSAVQEIAAARLHEAADAAAVVANGPFTRAARDLARTNNVALLHHEELQDWADRLTPPTR